MSFPHEGEFQCQVVDAEITFPKFPVPSKNDPPSGLNHAGQQLQAWYDICLKVQDADGNFDYWHGEMSNRTGVGNFKNAERWEQTLDTLSQIGFPVNFNQVMEQCQDQGEVTKIPNLIGLKCIAVTKASEPNDDGKVFVNLRYLKGADAGKPQGMSMAQLTQMFGGGQHQQQAQQQAPVQQQGQPVQQSQHQQQQFNQPVQQQQQAPVPQNQPQQQQAPGGPVTNPYAQQ